MWLRKLLSAGLSLLIAQALLAAASQAETGDPERIAVIVHTDNPTQTLTRREVRRLFLRERLNWASGERVTILERPNTAQIRAQFSEKVLRVSPVEAKHAWLSARLTSGAPLPRICRSPIIVKRYLSSIRGAIAYVYESQVDETMKVVAWVSQ